MRGLADGIIIENNYAFKTPATIEVDPSSYTIQLTYEGVTKNYEANVTEGSTIRIDGQLSKPPSKNLMYIAVLGIVTVIAWKVLSNQ